MIREWCHRTCRCLFRINSEEPRYPLPDFKTGTGTLASAEFTGVNSFRREPVPVLKPHLEDRESAGQLSILSFRFDHRFFCLIFRFELPVDGWPGELRGAEDRSRKPVARNHGPYDGLFL